MSHVLVTGGAGFVGCNLADRLLRDGRRVVILDDLSRPGVGRNAAWLQRVHGDRLERVQADVRDPAALAEAVDGAAAIFHLAAQVAVTTSLDDPRRDFDVNARGTLEVLEAARAQPTPPLVVFTSTNKVYGELGDVAVTVRGGRYEPTDPALAARGVDEARPLSFHSPYGCSKGAADQYVLDWSHTYGLPAVVLRMSCIYGPRQFGTEDQGWVAHFLRNARAGRPLTIYGDGRQVRDVLFVDDLVEAMLALLAAPDRAVGRAFNVGGGPAATLSLLELIDAIAQQHGRRPEVGFAPWRRADQRWYVSDPSALGVALGWAPRTGVDEGLRRLDAWLARLDPQPAAPAARTPAPA